MTDVMINGNITHALDIPRASEDHSLSPERNGRNSEEEEEEEDVFPDTPRSSITNPSPRCEAYVMTGEKILRLNSKVSPSYAEARQDLLPPSTDILSSPDFLSSKAKRGPFDDLPATEHHVSKKVNGAKYARMASHPMTNGISNSHSEHVIGEPGQAHTAPATPGGGGTAGGEASSSVTVNAMCRGGNELSSTTVQSAQSPTSISGPQFPDMTTQSEPASPAKYAFLTSTNASTHNGGVDLKQDHTLTIRIGSGEDVQEGEVTIQARDHHNASPTSSAASTPLKEKLRQLGSKGRTSSQASAHQDPDSEAAARLAKRLFALDGFKKSDVAPHLSKNNDFSAQVALEYCRLYNFGGLRLDAAMRQFLRRFSLVGESSERERVLSYFSHRYHECNPGLFASEDEVHALTVAILLLNTDLHGPNLGKRMNSHQFVENLSHTGFVYKRPLLKQLYESIKNSPIEFARDSPTEGESNGSHKQSLPSDIHLLEIPDPESQVEYKKGYLMRKCVIDEDGKKTPFGRRGWKMFYGTLKGLVLYLHKDEHGFRRGAYQTFHNAIRIHHAWATRPHSYKKRQHVFRLRTANLGEYLFQTSDPSEVRSWMDAINFVSACFSAPPLPAPVSSSSAFHRPLFPSSLTKLSMDEQAMEHERQVESLREQLERLKEDAPPLTSRGRVVEEYFFRERYLEEEKERFATYSHLLRSKLEGGVEDPREGSGGAWSEENGESSKTSSGGPQQSSGQSDRLSYRAAISSNWAETSTDTIY